MVIVKDPGLVLCYSIQLYLSDHTFCTLGKDFRKKEMRSVCHWLWVQQRSEFFTFSILTTNSCLPIWEMSRHFQQMEKSPRI